MLCLHVWEEIHIDIILRAYSVLGQPKIPVGLNADNTSSLQCHNTHAIAVYMYLTDMITPFWLELHLHFLINSFSLFLKLQHIRSCKQGTDFQASTTAAEGRLLFRQQAQGKHCPPFQLLKASKTSGAVHQVFSSLVYHPAVSSRFINWFDY